MTPLEINRRLYGSPFRPFKIHMTDGTAVPVTTASGVLVGESFMILPVKVGKDPNGFPLVKRWRALALSHMVQFSDIDEPVTGKRPKKRG